MERFVDDALVLGSVDYGEADRLVTLFARGAGKLTAFAAGARKSRRRFAGALEPCTWLKAQLVERRGSTLRLDGVDVVRTFSGLRSDLSRIGRALYVVELCRELLREREPHPELFDAATAWLGLLEEGRAGPTSLIAFELEAPRFDAAQGGGVCERCQGRVPGAPHVAPELLEALAGLQEGQKTPLSAPVRAQARGLLNAFISHHLGRALRGVDFLRQLGVD
jgi:DNA repair protein RecO (recombination protein O)